MKKIGFIGAYDKIDCIIYLAKIIRTVGKTVLVVDSTLMQKAKYIVPSIIPTVSYVTEFEEIDIAVGFKDFTSIKRYLSVPDDQELNYDYILLDVDNGQTIENFGIAEAEKNYFVTAFDLYSLKRGLEALSNLRQPLNLTKVLFSNLMLKEEDEYLNFLSQNYNISWNEYKIYFPIGGEDETVIAENQRLSKIKFRQLSPQYKESLEYMAEEIMNDVKSSEVRKAMKNIEKDKGV